MSRDDNYDKNQEGAFWIFTIWIKVNHEILN